MSPDHILAAPLRRLFAEEGRTFDELRRDLRAAVDPLPIRGATLFGSVARHEERPASDIDLLVEVGSVGNKVVVADALSAKSASFARRYGNTLSTLVIIDRPRRRQGNLTLRRNIERDGVRIAP